MYRNLTIEFELTKRSSTQMSDRTSARPVKIKKRGIDEIMDSSSSPSSSAPLALEPSPPPSKQHATDKASEVGNISEPIPPNRDVAESDRPRFQRKVKSNAPGVGGVGVLKGRGAGDDSAQEEDSNLANSALLHSVTQDPDGDSPMEMPLESGGRTSLTVNSNNDSQQSINMTMTSQ
jgi:hypothetical protein